MTTVALIHWQTWGLCYLNEGSRLECAWRCTFRSASSNQIKQLVCVGALCVQLSVCRALLNLKKKKVIV